MGIPEVRRKREDRFARMREDGRKEDKEDQDTRGQGPDGWMIRMKNVTSVSKHFTDQAGNLGLRVSLRLLEV